MRRLFVLASIAIIAVLYIHCGGSSSSSPTETNALTGRLSASDYSVARNDIFDKIFGVFFEKISFAVGTRVDQVWAIPLHDGEFGPWVFQYVKKANVSTDGSFSLDLDEGQDWSLILINTAASTRKDQVVGYLTMTAGTSGLQKFNMSSGVALGDVSRNGSETSTSRTTSDNSSGFSLNVSQLEQVAITDDTLRVIKNAFRNYDESTGIYTTIKPFYLWRGSSVGASILNTYTTPATVVSDQFKGYLYYFNSNRTAMDYTRICNGTDALSLYPPGTVSNIDNSESWGASTPLDNSGSKSTNGNSCGAGNLYLRDDTGVYSSGKSYQFNFTAGSSYLAPPIVSGDWSLKVNSTEIAAFDGQLGSPFQNDDSTQPIIFIPSIRVTTSSGNISSVDVKWYQRQESGTYSQVTDASLLGQMVSVSIEITDYNVSPTKSERAELTAAGSYSYAPSTYVWAIPSQGSGTATTSDVAIGYVMNGVSYRFENRF